LRETERYTHIQTITDRQKQTDKQTHTNTHQQRQDTRHRPSERDTYNQINAHGQTGNTQRKGQPDIHINRERMIHIQTYINT